MSACQTSSSGLNVFDFQTSLCRTSALFERLKGKCQGFRHDSTEGSDSKMYRFHYLTTVNLCHAFGFFEHSLNE